MPAEAMNLTAPCPCGSSAALADCCAPVIENQAPARTAEALMRSRYSAYALGRIEHVTRTLHPDARADHDEAAAAKWSAQSEWLGLSILLTEKGGEQDDKGTVEFKCRYRVKGEVIEHHERAFFLRHQGAWVFRDSETPKQATFVRTEPRIGRNEPCPCGSGKKAKRCCA